MMHIIGYDYLQADLIYLSCTSARWFSLPQASLASNMACLNLCILYCWTLIDYDEASLASSIALTLCLGVFLALLAPEHTIHSNYWTVFCLQPQAHGPHRQYISMCMQNASGYDHYWLKYYRNDRMWTDGHTDTRTHRQTEGSTALKR